MGCFFKAILGLGFTPSTTLNPYPQNFPKLGHPYNNDNPSFQPAKLENFHQIFGQILMFWFKFCSNLIKLFLKC
jgi:hypothetical protein